MPTINAINNYEGHNVRTVPPSKTATGKTQQCLKDESNRGAMDKTGAGPFFPLALYFLIFGLGACFGFETGYAINLARDFGPRPMSYAVGYDHEVWSAGGYYFWSKCSLELFLPIGYREIDCRTHSGGGRSIPTS